MGNAASTEQEIEQEIVPVAASPVLVLFVGGAINAAVARRAVQRSLRSVAGAIGDARFAAWRGDALRYEAGGAAVEELVKLACPRVLHVAVDATGRSISFRPEVGSGAPPSAEGSIDGEAAAPTLSVTALADILAPFAANGALRVVVLHGSRTGEFASELAAATSKLVYIGTTSPIFSNGASSAVFCDVLYGALAGGSPLSSAFASASSSAAIAHRVDCARLLHGDAGDLGAGADHQPTAADASAALLSDDAAPIYALFDAGEVGNSASSLYVPGVTDVANVAAAGTPQADDASASSTLGGETRPSEATFLGGLEILTDDGSASVAAGSGGGIDPLCAPSLLLDPRSRAVRLDRTWLSSVLADWFVWCDGGRSKSSAAPMRVCVIHGPSGAGKTRFCVEQVLARHGAGWTAGFLPTLNAEALAAPIDALQRDTLLVLDDADHREDVFRVIHRLYEHVTAAVAASKVAATAEALAAADASQSGSHPPALRAVPRLCVVLLARDGPALIAAAQRSLGNVISEGLPITSMAMPTVDDVAMREAAYKSAFAAFAAVRRRYWAPEEAAVPHGGLSAPHFACPLYIHVAALDSVLCSAEALGSSAATTSTAAALLTQFVTRHELRAWEPWLPLASNGPEQRMAALRMLAFLMIAGPSDERRLRRALSADGVPDFRPWVIAMVRLYPQATLQQLVLRGRRRVPVAARLPHSLLGAAAILATLTEERGSPGTTQRGRLAALLRNDDLVRDSAALADARAVLQTAVSDLFASDEEELAVGLLPDGVVSERAEAGEAAVAVAAAAASATAVSHMSPNSRFANSITRLQRSAGDNDDSDSDDDDAATAPVPASVAATRAAPLPASLAAWERRNTAAAAHDGGDADDDERESGTPSPLPVVAPPRPTPTASAALREAQAAVAQLRPSGSRMWRDSSGDADLATALLVLAARLGDEGLRTEAVAAAAEAVEIRKKLAARDARVYQPLLAAAFMVLSARYAAIAQHVDALKAVKGAVSRYRVMAAAEREAALPSLAAAVQAMSVRFAAAGHAPNALKAAEEAESMFRELLLRQPAAFAPALASAVHNRALRLASSGQRNEALNAAQEAVSRYRDLSAVRPDAFDVELATALNTLGNRLADLHMHIPAYNAAVEAVALRRKLASRRAGLPDVGLAGSLHNLALRCTVASRPAAEALEAAQDAVALWRQLARLDDAVGVEADLVSAVINAGQCLADAGKRDDAIDAFDEALERATTLERRGATAAAAVLRDEAQRRRDGVVVMRGRNARDEAGMLTTDGSTKRGGCCAIT